MAKQKTYLHSAELGEGCEQPWFAGFAERAARVVDFAFGGMHHVVNPKWNRGNLTCSTYQHLSTWDYNSLTKLVVAAHENCVRVEIRPSSPRHLGILISKSVPMAEAGEHPMYAGHPTLQEHLEKLHVSLWRSMKSAPRDGTEVLVAIAPVSKDTEPSKKVARFLHGRWRVNQTDHELVLLDEWLIGWMAFPQPIVEELARV